MNIILKISAITSLAVTSFFSLATEIPNIHVETEINSPLLVENETHLSNYFHNFILEDYSDTLETVYFQNQDNQTLHIINIKTWSVYTPKMHLPQLIVGHPDNHSMISFLPMGDYVSLDDKRNITMSYMKKRFVDPTQLKMDRLLNDNGLYFYSNTDFTGTGEYNHSLFGFIDIGEQTYMFSGLTKYHDQLDNLINIINSLELTNTVPVVIPSKTLTLHER
jgi:hypothetical protein